MDASESSRRAVRSAAGLVCGRPGSGLVLVHVIPWSQYDITTLQENETRHAERLRELEAAEKELLDPLQAEAEAAGATVEATLARHGHIAETLLALAQEHGAHHIVVGRTGESRLRSLIFGSTPAHLVQVCTVPVTVVP